MKRLSRNLTTIYRAEKLIAGRRLAVVQQQTFLMALAGLAALAGLILLNVALFLVLQGWVSPPLAAGILALLNLVLAAILATAARRSNVEDEIAPAVEVRDMAIADIEDEIGEMALEARDVVQAVKGLGSNPLGALTPLIAPVLSALLKKKQD